MPVRSTAKKATRRARSDVGTTAASSVGDTRGDRREPRKHPRQGRARATVDAIVSATAIVLKREGYAGLTTNKVAEAAGVSVGSLYQYFPGKDALVIALLLSFAEQQQRFVFNAIFALRDAPIEQVVRATVDGMRKAVQRDPALSAILMHHIPRVGELGEVVEYFQRQVAEPIAAFLASRHADIGVRDTRAAAFLLAHSVQPLLERLRVSALDEDERERVFEELCAMITAYLRAPQARQA